MNEQESQIYDSLMYRNAGSPLTTEEKVILDKGNRERAEADKRYQKGSSDISYAQAVMRSHQEGFKGIWLAYGLLVGGFLFLVVSR